MGEFAVPQSRALRGGVVTGAPQGCDAKGSTGLSGAPGPAASVPLPSHSPVALPGHSPPHRHPWRPPRDSLTSPPHRMISYKADLVTPLSALHQRPLYLKLPPGLLLRPLPAWPLPGSPGSTDDLVRLLPSGCSFTALSVLVLCWLVPTTGPLHLLFPPPRALPFIWF